MTLFPGIALVTGAASGIPLLTTANHFSFNQCSFQIIITYTTILISNPGIGRAAAISFALEGCRQIAICDRNLDGLHETQRHMKDFSNDVEILINQVDMLKEA